MYTFNIIINNLFLTYSVVSQCSYFHEYSLLYNKTISYLMFERWMCMVEFIQYVSGVRCHNTRTTTALVVQCTFPMRFVAQRNVLYIQIIVDNELRWTTTSSDELCPFCRQQHMSVFFNNHTRTHTHNI